MNNLVINRQQQLQHDTGRQSVMTLIFSKTQFLKKICKNSLPSHLQFPILISLTIIINNPVIIFF